MSKEIPKLWQCYRYIKQILLYVTLLKIAMLIYHRRHGCTGARSLSVYIDKFQNLKVMNLLSWPCLEYNCSRLLLVLEL